MRKVDLLPTRDREASYALCTVSEGMYRAYTTLQNDSPCQMYNERIIIITVCLLGLC